jgi:hypothetical protein
MGLWLVHHGILLQGRDIKVMQVPANIWWDKHEQ